MASGIKGNVSVFNRLKRIFSSNVISRNIGGSAIRNIDINQIQQIGNMQTWNQTDMYNRFMTPTGVEANAMNQHSYLRTQLWSEYESMDQDALIAPVLDIIAENAMMKNSNGDILNIESSDENIKQVLYNLFYDVLNIEHNLWGWTRTMAKYGDCFLRLHMADKVGITDVEVMTVHLIERREGHIPSEPFRVQFEIHPHGIAYRGQEPPTGNKANPQALEHFEVAHFRLVGEAHHFPYGRSYLEPARRVFKQLSLMEEAAFIHRIVNAADKRVYKIDVGTLNPNEIQQVMQKTMENFKTADIVDPETGDYNMKFNMQNIREHIYMPKRGSNDVSSVENLSGLNFDSVQDIEYLQKKLFAALKIPKAYCGYEGDLSGKATLAQEDIRFAQTIQRVQNSLVSEFKKIAIVHLTLQGFTEQAIANFNINLTTPSVIYERERIEMLKEKVAIAKDMYDSNLFSSDHTLAQVFGFSERKIDQIRDEKVYDSFRDFQHSQISSEGNDPEKTKEVYGTKHEVAHAYGGRKQSTLSRNARKETVKVDTGRPVENPTSYRTQGSNLGDRDPLGSESNKEIKEQIKIDKQLGIAAKQLMLDVKKRIVDTLITE